MEDKIFGRLKKNLPEAKSNVLLKNYTTFKIGGPARYFFIAKTKEDLVRAVKTAKKFKLLFFILGGGSNLLVSDKGFKGLVIKFQFSDLKLKNGKIYASAGVRLSNLAGFALENSFKGFEWAAGIPGTVGGAIFGHAQAFGEKISDAIESVEALDVKTLKFKKLTKKQCQFSLKSSIFKDPPAGAKNLIIISAVFAPEKDGKEKIQERVEKFLNYRKDRHPMSFPSAGSMFVNPEKKGEIIHAGYLIEKCGLKGKKIGKAQISEKHANFIINLGGAKAKDVLALINLAKQKVKKTFGVELETEVQLVGF